MSKLSALNHCHDDFCISKNYSFEKVKASDSRGGGNLHTWGGVELWGDFLNVSQLWSKIEINLFGETTAADLKIANIMSGIMSHSSLYPCIWCYGKTKELSECATLKTIRNIRENSDI